MRGIIKLNSLFLIPLFVFFFGIVKAEIPIWQVGTWDTFREFDSLGKKIIDYQVPSDWESLKNQDDPYWEGFPDALYPFNTEKENNPQEIRIHFSYPEDYKNPILSIRAKPSSFDPNIKHYLIVYKGDQELFIGEEQINAYSVHSYYFNLGYIKKGLHERNIIIIKSIGPSDRHIWLDALELFLFNKDSDGDGVSDVDEGEIYKDHNSSVRIPINSYNPNPYVIKSITLNLEKTEETSPAFFEVKSLDPNSLNFPYLLYPDCYLPYDLLNFEVKGIEPGASLLLRIGSTDPLSPSVRFYNLQGTNDWQEIAFDFMDANSASIVLNDGGSGDSDKERNGHIHTILAILYPTSLNFQIEKMGCFIKSVSWRKNVAVDF